MVQLAIDEIVLTEENEPSQEAVLRWQLLSWKPVSYFGEPQSAWQVQNKRLINLRFSLDSIANRFDGALSLQEYF